MSRRVSPGLLPILLTLVLVLAAAGVALATSAATGGGEAIGSQPENEPRTISRKEAIAQLPCFNCHSLANFFSEEKPTGVFAHSLHSPFGIHCNKCHTVMGHREPQLNQNTCSECHQLDTMVYPGGGMGEVAFSHEMHTMMFGCSDCHNDTFVMKTGANDMTMNTMYAGNSCGSCHDGNTAFAAMGDCTSCHKQ